MTQQSAGDMQERLAAFLEVQMPDARNLVLSNLTRSGPGYSRENWPFNARWEQDGETIERRLILRRDPTGSVLDTSREPEYRALRAIEGHTSFRTPEIYWADLDGEWLERPFIIMNRYEGANDRRVLVDGGIPLEVRLRLAHRYPAILAEIHALDWSALGLSALGVPEGPTGAAAAQVAYWERYMERQLLEPSPVWVETGYWLKRHLPEQRRVTIVHGDFRPGNSLTHDGDVAVMLDWEMVHLGDPMEDLGWYCNPPYASEHFIPGEYGEDDLFRAYEQCSGHLVDGDAVEFYRVLAVWKLEAIVQTGVKSFCEGRTDRTASPTSAMLRIMAGLIDL